MDKSILYFYSAPQQPQWRNSNNPKKRKLAQRITVAGRVENGNIIINSSKCSESENFVKQTGRHIAVTRITMNDPNKPNLVVACSEGESPIKTFIAAAINIVESNGLTLKEVKQNGENVPS